MRYLSIDIETTGLNPQHCQVIDFAAIVDDFSWPADYKRPAIQFLVQHPLYHCEPYAAGMHASLWKRLAMHLSTFEATTPELVGKRLKGFCIQADIDPLKIVAAGKNFAGFDLRFLKRLPNFNEEVAFHHRCLDPGMLYLLSIDEVPPSTEECLRRAGLSAEVAHTALADAQTVIQLLRAKFHPFDLTPISYVL